MDELSLESAFLESLNTDFDISVHKILRLVDNERLNSITGISVGQALDILFLKSNNAIVEGWEVLQSLNRIEENLTITDMEDLSYVVNLEHIESMNLTNMPNRNSLDQFSSLVALGDLRITDLQTLSDFSRLATVEFFGLNLNLFLSLIHI